MGTNSNMTKEEWRQLLDSSEEKTNGENNSMDTDETDGFTEEHFAFIEKRLDTRLKPEQTERIMKLFRKFHKDRIQAERDEGLVWHLKNTFSKNELNRKEVLNSLNFSVI